MEPAADLAARALYLGMAFMADEHDVVAALGIAPALGVNLMDERARGVDDVEIAGGCTLLDKPRNAMRAEHREGAVRDLLDVVHEDRAAGPRLATTCLLWTISWRT